MNNLISYKEFLDNSAETSNYNIPKMAIKPQSNDKIWTYIKDKFNKSPNWGINLTSQEKMNKLKRK